MFFRKKHKPRERFYLLPGQGGKNYHRKQMRFRLWAAAAGVFFGTLLGLVLWWFSRVRF